MRPTSWGYLIETNWGSVSKFRNLRKILVSVKIFACNSGAGNGCINFMDAWKNAFFLQEKPMSIKFLVLGGGGILDLPGGGVPILFLWARGFF